MDKLAALRGVGGEGRRSTGSVYLWSDLKAAQRLENAIYEVE